MYSSDLRQTSFVNFILPFGGELEGDNRWVVLSEIVPWDQFEREYRQQFSSLGAGSKPARMALGALILKERLKCSDEELVEQISENPYLQYFLGLEEFQKQCPFDSSMLVHFRKRISMEMLERINETVVLKASGKGSKDEDPPDSNGNSSNPSQIIKEDLQEKPNSGKLLLDATCAPSDITYPTDLNLLNEARVKSEKIIDVLYEKVTASIKKPRTYRQKARKEYLIVAKAKKPSFAKMRKTIRKQLGYLKRNLNHIDQLKTISPLTQLYGKQYRDLLVISELFRQQNLMYTSKTKRCDNRIVSIAQPHIRAVYRGKAKANYEFGAKLSVSLHNGYCFLDKLDWENYNESGDLQSQVEAYQRRFGFYPESLHVDQIYRTRENRRYCKSKGIRLSGPPLGRPLKDHSDNKKQARKDEIDRIPIEGKFGQAKRRYSLGLIMTKLKETSQCAIAIIFLVMNLQRRVTSFCFLLILRILQFILKRNTTNGPDFVSNEYFIA